MVLQVWRKEAIEIGEESPWDRKVKMQEVETFSKIILVLLLGWKFFKHFLDMDEDMS